MAEPIQRIPIEEEESILCERYHFEKTSLEDLLIKFCNQNYEYKIDDKRFYDILNKYVKAYTELSLFLAFLEKKYITDIIGKDKQVEFKVNFEFSEIELSYK